MPLICYAPRAFSEEKMGLIAKANLIITEYSAQGFDLTLRQLYYQFVARGFIPNVQKEYARLGDLISDARLAGLIDWNSIVDRTRNVEQNQHWDRPSKILEQAMNSYATNKWDAQDHYVEVWIEKDALKGVIAGVCRSMDVPYFSCRGYTSQSEMWAASQRLIRKIDDGKEVHIIHLGDHDPSGIDMSRDIQDRLELFTYGKVHLQRIALNMPQVEAYGPPPNPAKTTDSRFGDYNRLYGEESWELDALEPTVLVNLIKEAIDQYRDAGRWDRSVATETKGRDTIRYILQYFPDVIKFLRERRKVDTSEVICAGCGATVANPNCLCDASDRGFTITDGDETKEVKWQNR